MYCAKQDWFRDKTNKSRVVPAGHSNAGDLVLACGAVTSVAAAKELGIVVEDVTADNTTASDAASAPNAAAPSPKA